MFARRIAIVAAALLAVMSVHAAPWVLALDKAQGEAPLILVIAAPAGKLVGEAYLSPAVSTPAAADVAKLTATDTTLKGDVTVGKLGAYTLDVAVKDGALTGTYTGTAGDRKVEGAVRWGADLLPLGHALFLPSPARTVGWRGDGTGMWPGSTFGLRTWSETTNVIWKTEMASHSNSAPIVVGDKVFTLREPNYLVCVDAATGKVVWERENDPLEIRGVDAATVATAKRLAEMAKMNQFLILCLRPDDRSGNEKVLATAREFFKADDMLFRNLREAAALEPRLADLNATIDRILKLRDTDPLAAVRQSKPLYGSLGSYIVKTYRFHGQNTWPGYIDYTFATPVSDGARVYAAMGQNQVVCYDLEGNRVWAQSPGVSLDTDGRRPQGADRATYVQSPLLVDGTLVVQAGFTIRGFDADTGETRWELPYTPQGSSYSCGTSRALQVGGEHVIVTVHGWVVRVRDGKKVGDLKLGNMGSESGGASMISDEDGCVYFFCQDNSIAKTRLVAMPDGGVSGELVFRTKTTGFGGMTPIVHDGRIYVGRKGLSIFDAATGSLVKELPAAMQSVSLTMAGDRLVTVGSNTGKFSLFQIGQDVKSAGSGGLAWSRARVPWFEQQWPDLYAAITQSGGRKFDNTVPRQIMYGHPCYAGDRMYVRTVSHLYCIGDPAQPYQSPAAPQAR